MLKLSVRAILKIARFYRLVGDEAPIRSLRNLHIIPDDSSVAAEFIIDKQRYGIIVSSLIDNENWHEFWPGTLPDHIDVIPNPLDDEWPIAPFQGKFLICFRAVARSMRLDQFLSQTFDKTRSRSQWQKHIKAGHVCVNGNVITAPKYEISDTDDVSVTLPKTANTIERLPILYEDREVIVIDKPIGILTHAKGGITHEQTVADFFRTYTQFARESSRPGIVHRLDRDTSGVLIGARTDEAAAYLQQQFTERTVQKTYLAIVTGRPKLDEAMIDLPIGRHPQKPSTFRVDASGKSAQTAYRVLAVTDTLSLIRLQPKTGRTHQLRVHLAYLGTPILGDRIYGTPDKRLFLHAYQLTIMLPSGQMKTFTAPIPPAFVKFFPEVKL